MDWLPSCLGSIQSLHWLAQTPPVDPSPVANELDLLRSQIELLEKAYSNLDTTFQRYITLVQTALTIAGIAVTTVIGVGIWLFRGSLAEFRQTLQGVNAEVTRTVQQRVQVAVAEGVQNQQAIIEAEVQQRVQREVGLVVRNRIDRLEDVLRREALVSHISVDYILPVVEPAAWPQNLGFLLKVLKSRGFQALPQFMPSFQDQEMAQDLPMLTGDVVVLDLENAEVSADRRDSMIRWVAQKVPFQRSTLVVYTTGRHSAINELPAAGHYCIGANSPLSLVGHTVDAAYIADAIKQPQR